MAKKERWARIRYEKEYNFGDKVMEAYVLETYDPEYGWCLNRACGFQKKPGDTEAEYIHFSLIVEIMKLLSLGYKFAFGLSL